MNIPKPLLLSAVIFLGLLTTSSLAQTGKIAGTVTDQNTGDPLPGVNVVIEGTTQGATTDAEGYYTILNVTPGTYSLRASFVGYAAQVVEGVDVNIDLTTTVDFALPEEAVGLNEVVVQSQQPVVKPDVSANVANVSMDQVENIPVTSVMEVVGMQAGIQGLSVRGSGADEVSFMVDGMSMRDARDNTPFTAISYTSIDEVQVQTGGFNAEYGNMRSGLVNITTKEGPRDHYTADVILRYSPQAKKYFGHYPNAGVEGEAPPEDMAYWVRPYMDPDVAFAGTESGVWDRYTRRQYPSFRGWNSVSESTQEDPNLADLTPEQAQEVFQWQSRKDMAPVSDYEIDASIGGPVPVISDALGDLRFFTSYRQTQDAYIVPQRRDAHGIQMGQFKLTSNPMSRLKLQLNGMYSLEQGLSSSSQGFPGIHSGTGLVYDLENSNRRRALFAEDVISLSDVERTQVGFDLTHTLGSNTFYTVNIQRNASNYETGPKGVRDTTTIRTIGGMELDEAPLGYSNGVTGLKDRGNEFAFHGMSLGGTWGGSRDSSDVVLWSISSDITSQLNRYAQIKTGFDFFYQDYNSAHELYQPSQPSTSNPDYYWHRQTMQGAAFLQSKLEFEGLIANLGMRFDYFQPRGEWYDYTPYDRAFANNSLDEDVSTEPINGSAHLSPRVGVSFPVTTHSKLYFNYGHFRNVQQTSDLFVVRTELANSLVGHIGNPNLPMSKTVSYEMGYDQNIFDRYLLRISGYYKAQSDQPRSVNFESLDGRVNYSKPLPHNYGDIRGLEVTLERQRGRWFRGFVNYTFMVEKSGDFGFSQIYENRQKMREEVRTTRDHIQNNPRPQPYANMNLQLVSPVEFGPEIGGIHPIGDWRIGFIGYWRSGDIDTWMGGSNLEIEDNIQWKDYYMLDMRLTKNMSVGGLGDMQFFVDVNNLLNLRNMNSGSAFVGNFDFENYMQSLHLPEDTFEDFEDPYLFIYGDDRPGDYREWGVEFVPIEVRQTLPEEGFSRRQEHYGPLFYAKQSDKYYIWENSSWQEADPGKVDQVLEDKAYIDMPNSRYFTFLNPRDIRFGVRVTF